MSMPILWIFILTNAILVFGAPKLGHLLFDPLSYEANKYDKLKAFLRDVIAQNETLKPSTKSCSSCIEDNTEKTKPKPTTSEVIQKIARNNENSVKTPNKVLDLFKLFENTMAITKIKNPLREGSDGDGKKDPHAEYDFDVGKCRIVNNRLLCGYDKNKGDLKTDEFIDIGDGCRLFKERVECGYEEPPFTGNIRRPPARDDHSLRSRKDDDLKSIARTVLKAISEQEFKMKTSTDDSKTGSPSITERVSPKSSEDITNSTTAIVTDINTKVTSVTDSNSTLTVTTEFLETSTTEGTTEFSTNNTTETTPNVTSTTSILPKLVTIPILEYLLKYFLPLRMLPESSSTTTLAPSTLEVKSLLLRILAAMASTTTLDPSTLQVTSDLMVSETAVESATSSESEEFLTNDIEIDDSENFSVLTSPISESTNPIIESTSPISKFTSSISEVTGNSTSTKENQQTNVTLISSRLPKIVRRSAEAISISEETTPISETVREGKKPSRWCVEKGDRIVCYYADNSFVLD